MTLYADLGVPRDADEAAIRRAHRKGVKAHHPDAGGDREAFEKVQRAYLILSDPAKRARYDETGEAEQRPDPTTERVSMMLGNAFDWALASMPDFTREDLIERMRQHIAGNRAQAEAQRITVQAERERFEKVLARIRFNGGGSDMLGGILRHRIRELGRAADSVADAISVMGQAIERLEAYGYEFEAGQTPETASTWRVLGTGNQW